MIQANRVKRTAIKSSAAKGRTEEVSSPKSGGNGDLHQKISEKAYELYLERGCEHGHDAEDWAHAEKIVKGQL
ncbi:MAG: DUF2934 domain-containing protein [Candidatus Omnitrophica bacterium]|nr:DUF2934 domain-containing protein [Candidatus Omnitrophota bacterium]